MGKMSGTTRRATIWQVAERAEVSHQTVSRYLREDPKMRTATREKVRAAIEELDYTPNLSARSMRTKHTRRLGVVLPPAMHDQLSVILNGAIGVAAESGYTLEVSNADGDPRARFEKVLRLADSGQVEGVLVLAPIPPDTEHNYPGRAAIVVSADYDESNRMTGDLADASPVVELVEGLVDLGHRRLMHITGDLDFATARERRKVFIHTVEDLGLGPAHVVEGVWSPQAGLDAMLALPETDHPTAVVAASDTIAAGVIAGARSRGWSVPGRLSVTGWDNHVLGRHLEPALTTVDVDLQHVGRNSMTRLIALVRGEEPPDVDAAPTTTIWRDSTGPLGG